jgi:putative chitinase
MLLRMQSNQKLINKDNLTAMLGIPAARAAKWAEPLAAACSHYGIETPLQIAAFIAQVGHESGRLRYVREIWGPTSWQLRYEGRRDLGNTEVGDGSLFRGRGLIQITGRNNYFRAGTALDLDLINHPELLEQPEHAAMSAAWFWDAHHLNGLADSGDLRRITRIINGGYNGLEDRLSIYEKAKEVLHVS